MASEDSIREKPKQQQRRPPKEIGIIGRLYLVAYNTVQTLGWSYLLWQTVTHFLNRGTLDTFWQEIKWTVIIFQNAAVLEVVHAWAGLVPSGVLVTLAQVYSRVFLVCGALLPTSAAHSSPGLVACAVAWALTEVVRYSYYALNLLDSVPKLLLTLRYSLFLVLYPLGISGELLCMYHAISEIAERTMWSLLLPNTWNFAFSYNYFMVAYMLLYIPLSPVLFGHMVKQRKKMLGKDRSHGEPVLVN